MMVERRPRTLSRVAMAAVLVAGPVIRKTRAAPGDKPAVISYAAIGVDAVAQT